MRATARDDHTRGRRAGLAAAHHHAHRHEFPPDDITRYASPEPVILKVRGVLADEPVTRRQSTTDPLAPPRRTLQPRVA